MKVKLEIVDTGHEGDYCLVLKKGKNESEMHTHQVVGAYTMKDAGMLKPIVDDLNIAFERMWH
jgi:hypothetical protein